MRSGRARAAHSGGAGAASKLAHNIGNSLVHSMTEANPPRRCSLVPLMIFCSVRHGVLQCAEAGRFPEMQP